MADHSLETVKTRRPWNIFRLLKKKKISVVLSNDHMIKKWI